MYFFFLFKQKTAYEMRISDWSSDVCSSDLLSTLAAVLTIAGYSINDTVVIFDRVREMLRRYKKLELNELLNRAVNTTLSRTLLTSISTLIALLALFIFGGEVIRGFTAGLIWGILTGTFSSLGLAELGRASCRERGCTQV